MPWLPFQKSIYPRLIYQTSSKNTENKLVTGVQKWNLSAAFDTLDVEILVKKQRNLLNHYQSRSKQTIYTNNQLLSFFAFLYITSSEQ